MLISIEWCWFSADFEQWGRNYFDMENSTCSPKLDLRVGWSLGAGKPEGWEMMRLVCEDCEKEMMTMMDRGSFPSSKQKHLRRRRSCKEFLQNNCLFRTKLMDHWEWFAFIMKAFRLQWKMDACFILRKCIGTCHCSGEEGSCGSCWF